VIPPVYRGPYEFANLEVKAALGRDWLGQAEIWPPEPGPGDDEATDDESAVAAASK